MLAGAQLGFTCASPGRFANDVPPAELPRGVVGRSMILGYGQVGATPS